MRPALMLATVVSKPSETAHLSCGTGDSNLAKWSTIHASTKEET